MTECPNKDKGCSKIIYVKLMKAHLVNQCPFNKCHCPNEKYGCIEYINRNQIENHIDTECKYNPCCTCGGKLILGKNEHIECVLKLKTKLEELNRMIEDAEWLNKEAIERKAQLIEKSESILATNIEEVTQSEIIEESKQNKKASETTQSNIICKSAIQKSNVKTMGKNSKSKFKQNIVSKPKISKMLDSQILILCAYCKHEFPEERIKQHESLCKVMKEKKQEKIEFDKNIKV